MPSPTMGAILNRLTTAGKLRKSGDGWLARCPSHDDQDPSLSVTETTDLVLLHCHAGCTIDSIVAALGITEADLFLDHDSTTPPPLPMPLPFTRKPRADETLTATYQYTDTRDGAIAEKGRFELPEVDAATGKPKKSFRWRWQGDAPRWPGGPEMAHLALWGWELVAAAPASATVYYVEGEAAALACRAAGLLAVTHAGGASTKDFGASSLEVLRGRPVALWPDNDATGREYMATVHARIRELAASVRVISVPLPPKGDAVEFFANGGTSEQLEAGALLVGGPSVEYLRYDTIRIRMTSPMGTVSFLFEEIEQIKRKFDCTLTITTDAPGINNEPYSEDIDLGSNTQITNFRRTLDSAFGKGFDWVRLLNTAISLVKKSHADHDTSVDAYDIVPLTENEMFFHDPIVPLNAVTILFGDRGSSKSYDALDIAFCASIGEPFLRKFMPVVSVLYLDYEDNERNFRRRLDRLAAGHGLPVLPGMVRYQNMMGRPIVQSMRLLRRLIEQYGTGLIIVDSVGPACAGKPEDSVISMPMMQALRSLGVTVIALAHVSKSHGEQPADPFGSVFFSNLSRRTWYVERVQEEAADDIDVGFYCKKVNDGEMPRPVALHIRFQGRTGPVTIAAADMADTQELQRQRPLRWRIWDALDHGRELTVPDILSIILTEKEEAKALEKRVDNTLRTQKQMFVMTGKRTGDSHGEAGGRPANTWGRAANDGS